MNHLAVAVLEKMQEIAIITDTPGWHGEQIKQALLSRNLRSHYLSLSDCRIEAKGSLINLYLPGFYGLPSAAFIRGIPGGSLEQVIFRLNILHTFSNFGVMVYNNSRGIERTVDKSMTSLLLCEADIPSPQTWVCESSQQAEAIYQHECVVGGKRLVMKPLFGSQGIGIYLLSRESGLVHDEKFSGVYYLQSYIDCGKAEAFDIRVFVVAGKAIAAMTRHSSSLITNYAQGASCQSLPLNKELCRLSEAAVQAVGIEYAGVDLIADFAGQLYVVEVNSIPAWRGLQKATGHNIASHLVEDLCQKIAMQKLQQPDSPLRMSL